jgi:hypothetical protein
VFTLPIWLGFPDSPGYPRPDVSVHEFFSVHLWNGDLFPIDGYIRIASFIAAAHREMLRELKKRRNAGLDGEQLLADWHDAMEGEEEEDGFRESFFTAVVDEAKILMEEVQSSESRNRIVSGYRCHG